MSSPVINTLSCSPFAGAPPAGLTIELAVVAPFAESDGVLYSVLVIVSSLVI